MLAIGANLSYNNTSFLWKAFFARLGFKWTSLVMRTKTNLRNNAADPGTTFPRQAGICAKYSATTVPTSNASGDAPSGIGDICVYFNANNVGGVPAPTTATDLYRCSAYTNATTFTWTKLT